MNKYRLKRSLLIITVLMLLVSLVACGKEDKNTSTYSYPVTGSYQESAVAAENYGGFSPRQAMGSYEENGFADVVESSATGTAETALTASTSAEKIIYEANATLESTEFDATVEALEAMIEKQEGWIESSSLSGNSYSNLSRGSASRRSADYTIRFPSEKFAEVMSELPTLGNVPYSHVYTENVTAQYYDTEARRNSYAAQEQRLLELLDKAETVSDVIEIENELTEVRYRIESLETSLRSWDRRVNWSTLYLTVNEVFEYTPEKPRSYFSSLGEALSDGIELLGDFFLGLAEMLPVLLVVIILIILLILGVKRIICRKKKNKKNTDEQKENS